MKETELKPIEINLTPEGEKIVCEAFKDLAKGIFETQNRGEEDWVRKYAMEGRQ